MAKPKTEKTVETKSLASFMSLKPTAENREKAYVRTERPSQPCWARFTIARDEAGNPRTDLPRAVGDWQKPMALVVNVSLFANGRLDKPILAFDYTWEEAVTGFDDADLATEFPYGYTDRNGNTLSNVDVDALRAKIGEARQNAFRTLMVKLQKVGKDAQGNPLSEERTDKEGAAYVLQPGHVFYAVWCPRTRGNNVPNKLQEYRRGEGGVLVPVFKRNADGQSILDKEGKPIPVTAYNSDELILLAGGGWGDGEARDLRRWARAMADSAKVHAAGGGGQQLPPGVGEDADSGADPGQLDIND